MLLIFDLNVSGTGRMKCSPSWMFQLSRPSAVGELLIILHLVREAYAIAAIHQVEDHAGHVVTAVPSRQCNPKPLTHPP